MLSFLFTKSELLMSFQNAESLIPPSAVGCTVGFSLILVALLLSKLNKSVLNGYGI